MPLSNENIRKAQYAKYDEFYTELSQIEAELNNYTDKFKGKVVYCNCDDPFESNFVKYFLMNFNRLGLKELIAAGYTTDPAGETGPNDTDPSYAIRVRSTKEYIVGTREDLDEDGVECFLTAEKDNLAVRLTGNAARDESGNPVKVSVKEKYQCEDGKTKTRTIKRDLFYRAGDFRSDMSIELLKQADIVATNPPFSLFREYVAQLMEYNKQFLIVGSINAVIYNEFFYLVKDNKVWLGCSSNAKEYMTTAEYATRKSQSTYRRDGKWYVQVPTMWFTNIDHAKRHQMPPLVLRCTYYGYGHEDLYPKYDEYDAINVDKLDYIPCDYEPCWFKCPSAASCRFAQTEGREDAALCEQSCNGRIGVPPSYMSKHCPEQFVLIGLAESPHISECVNGEKSRHKVFTRIIIRRTKQAPPANTRS